MGWAGCMPSMRPAALKCNMLSVCWAVNGFAFKLTVAGTGYPTIQVPGFCLLKVLPLHYSLQEAVAVGSDVGATARCRSRRRCCSCRAF